MNDINQTYSQSPIGQMKPPLQGAMIQQHPRISMRQKMVKEARKMHDVFPRWLSTYPIATYILALTIVSFIYSSHSIPWYYMLSGVAAVMIFFLYGSSVAIATSRDKIRSEKNFEKKIFFIAFIPRVLFVLLLYLIFRANYGDAFGFENEDAKSYDAMGQFIAYLIERGNYHFVSEITQWNGGKDDISDMGYGIYVGFIYWLTGSGNLLNAHFLGENITTGPLSILTLRLIKCVLSSITALLVYRLAKRNFGEQTGRVAAIFVALWPNFWYYCSAHLKEVEMVFLTVLFIEQADQMLRSRQFTAWKVIPVLLIVSALFTFRTVLAIVCILAFIFAVVMSSSKVVNWGKRIIIGGLSVALIGLIAGDRLQEETQQLYEQVQGGQQHDNMEWRAQRKDEGGTTQRFAKYAGAAVFAPMIFSLPFPTMVDVIAGQDIQQLLNGGNYVKNIMSFFTIIAVVMLLMSGKWRDHLLPLSFMFGYLIVLTMSSFAHSERFHQPVMPLEMMFIAYGLSVAVTKSKYKRWFTYWCVLMFIGCIAWNWFKMAGRGLA